MTFLDIYKKLHQDMSDKEFWYLDGEPAACPYECGLESHDECKFRTDYCKDCYDCWRREIPELLTLKEGVL